MDAQGVFVRFGQAAGDMLARYLGLFGDGNFAHVVAFAILVCGAILIALTLVSGWSFLRGMAPRPAKGVASGDEPSLYGVPLFLTKPDPAKSSDDLALDLQDIRTTLARAVGDLAEERRIQASRILTSQNEMHAVFAKMEGAMNGMLKALERSGGQAATIDLRLDALRESVADLSERLSHGLNRGEAQFQSHLPAEKISAEIAEIVRELQAG